jgi:hypothetical protein
MLKVGVPLALAAGTVGLAKGIGSSVREGMMETAFGDPNADAAFLGTNLSARYMMGSMMGGPMGAAMRYSAPQDQYMINAVAPTLGAAAVSSVAGGVVGGGIGLKFGKRFAAVGAAAGAAVGAFIGGAVAPASYSMAHIRRNSDFYRSSPYSRSRQMAEELNASGDIVLGMHNSRGGF